MSFVNALNILSKSSSFAVSTDSDQDLELSQIKSDLYVEMPIENDFFSLLEKINPDSKQVIFLCGSSGDGKSELMLKAKKRFAQPHLHFHLDATHSFEPHTNAIITLDRLFEDYDKNNHSLVIGINVGMLGNYAEDAAQLSIRAKLKKYLELKEDSGDFKFINFEDYPKFEITENGYESEFISKILNKLTSPDSKLYTLYLKDEFQGLASSDHHKFVNYKMICNKSIQKVLVELLLKIRLFRNQFITARTFLDLIYELITKKDYLFNNLFKCHENEILEKAVEFDPSRLRTKSIDRFFISYELDSLPNEFKNFKRSLESELKMRDLNDSSSYIRLFYILKLLDLGNNYHHTFNEDFNENLLMSYLDIYRYHNYYNSIQFKSLLRNFYNKELIGAIRSYINKKAPYLDDDQFLIAEYSKYKVISHLKLSPEFVEIEKNKNNKAKPYFTVYLRIKNFYDDQDDPIVKFNVDINLYELLSRLRAGYRPNKNDRSVVIVLNEIVNRLLHFANQSNQINFQSDSRQIKFIREDGCIEVGN